MSSSQAENEPVTAVTVDIHAGDRAEDIQIAAQLLAAEGIRATFFVPASVFHESEATRVALRELPRLGHEVGSHGYEHDWPEIDALVRGRTQSELSFLARAHAEFANFYGRPPKAFRSPVWCRLGDAALDELNQLEYEVDSSATPQRVQLLTSRPFCRGWMSAPRSPFLIRPGILEIPTSAAVLQAGSTTFRLLRSALSPFFVRLLLAEAELFPARVIVLQFDSRDLNRNREQLRPRNAELADYWPRRYGGFAFRRHLLEHDPAATAATAWTVLRMLKRTLTMAEVRSRWLRRKKIGGGGGS